MDKVTFDSKDCKYISLLLDDDNFRGIKGKLEMNRLMNEQRNDILIKGGFIVEQVVEEILTSFGVRGTILFVPKGKYERLREVSRDAKLASRLETTD